MCVICIKDKGAQLPSMKELQAAYHHNPDGCGLVSSNGVYWRGLSFKEFCKQLQKVREEDSCIIHFRIGTHGSNKASNCHPFKATYKDQTIYFAHNGILNIPTYNDMTDSETMFRDILAPAAFMWGIRSERFIDLVDKEIGASKFAFMQDGQITLFGNWIAEGGLFWSNLNHRQYYHFAPKKERDIISYMNKKYTPCEIVSNLSY